MTNFRVLIPARYESVRLPGKLLRKIHGKTILQRTYEQAQKSAAQSIVIATDNAQIAEHAESFSAQVVMTAETHPNGTTRIAEAIEKLAYAEDEIIVNVQGDEPFLSPRNINQVAKLLADAPATQVATLATPIMTIEELKDPNIVKVVCDQQGHAMYFSRAQIPFDRDTILETKAGNTEPHFLRHIGIYAYWAGFLQTYVKLPTCPIEQLERLEQLRILWHGEKMSVELALEVPAAGIDTEKDLQNAERQLTLT